jgi:mono/diheme cytochrome c family protein
VEFNVRRLIPFVCTIIMLERPAEGRDPMHALRALRRTVAACLLAALPPGAHAQSAATFADVEPIFRQHCVLCHSGSSPAAGLRLDTLNAVLKGGTRGPVAKAGAPAESELVRRIKGVSQPRMPMTGPPFLSDSEVATIERWIGGGLQAGGSAAAASTTAASTATAPPPRPRPGERVTYLHVAPIFATRCAKCHTDNGQMGPPPEGYRLTSHAATVAAADRARVVPGHPAASELMRRIRGHARPRMPLDGPPFLDPEEMQLIEDWIAQGARDAAGVAAPIPVGASVRLHGTLTAGAGLDGLALQFGQGARIERQPAPGAYVEVRGRMDSSGRVVVERLRAR